MILATSGVAVGGGGAFAPNPYTSAPTPCMRSFIVYVYSIKVLTHCMHINFYYTATASNTYVHGLSTWTVYME